MQVTELSKVTQLTVAQTLHPLPLLPSVSVEAERRRRPMELTEATEATKLTKVKELTVAQTLHPLPSVSVEAD